MAEMAVGGTCDVQVTPFLALALIAWVVSASPAGAVGCERWLKRSSVGSKLKFDGLCFQDKLRQRSCEAGTGAYADTMPRSRLIEPGPPYVIYEDTVTGPRVLGLSGGPDPRLAGLFRRLRLKA